MTRHFRHVVDNAEMTRLVVDNAETTPRNVIQKMAKTDDMSLHVVDFGQMSKIFAKK